MKPPIIDTARNIVRMKTKDTSVSVYLYVLIDMLAVIDEQQAQIAALRKDLSAAVKVKR